MRVLLALLLATGLPLTAASLWLEGEDATGHEHDPQPQWYDQVNVEALSGGAWLSHFNHEREGRAAFDVTIAERGDYALWLRANYHSARLSLRLNQGEWHQVDFDGQRLRGKTLVSGNRELDIRFLAWVRAGVHTLAPGTHRLEVRFHSDNRNHGAIDALVFTTLDWKPFGTDRPPGLVEADSGETAVESSGAGEGTADQADAPAAEAPR